MGCDGRIGGFDDEGSSDQDGPKSDPHAPARRRAGRSLEVTASVLYIIGTYPLLTTTFIDREILELRKQGVGVEVVSIRRSGRTLSEYQHRLAQDVSYVLPAPVVQVLLHNLRFALRRPARYLTVMWQLVRGAHPSRARRVKTLGHFFLGVHVAGIASRTAPARVHAHFVDRAATLAIVVSRLLDIPYSATAHANDIYVDPVLLPEKIAWSDFVATCTGYNADHLRSIADPSKIRLIHHGLDLRSIPSSGAIGGDPVTILAVGQLKPKKGFRFLLEACEILKASGRSFVCEIVGEGPMRESLEQQIAALGLGRDIFLRGALPHGEVLEHMSRASVFTLPSVVTPEGDRDGIPNVILEAMATGLPVVSTRVSAIPEVVIEGRTGLLVEPGDVVGLADALMRVLDDDGLRQRLGDGGRNVVAERFDVERNTAELRTLLETFNS